ncbi:ABC transporter permease subunit [Virgisporangium aurantiacum]|uniref:Transporter n=1 Tax=Virgisporangium aurantiacum TaxID=175570 RepID=A0A8J3Z341_9ACTN|nr:ABC transporter permease subunit [Virgisporangium aurantiacum]GIJ56719.1 transporter [Virgisporangium aurantiacum]
MIWLTWRQFRAQSIVAAGALALFAAYLVYLGLASRDFYDTKIVGCTPDTCRLVTQQFQNDFGDMYILLGFVLIAVPGLIGIFWGAPLVTRELEEHTDRLVWNQSVTRARWLAVKLGGIALAAVAVTGLFSLLLTWSASRYDYVLADRFAASSFDARNIVPMAYGLFAFVLGTVVGMVVRRTVPAMAITLAVFAVVQVLIPSVVRQHLMPPVTTTVTVDASVFDRIDGISLRESGGMFLQGYSIPGGWSLSTEAQLLKADGSAYGSEDARKCMAAGSREENEACTVAANLHFSHTYHPGSRYWPFQWIELSLYVTVSALLAAFGFWWLRRKV